MTTKRKPLATKQKKGLSGVKVAMIVLQAKKVKETEGVYKGFLKTVFYNNGKLIATIPAYQTQPRKSQKTITLNSFKYALNWSKQ